MNTVVSDKKLFYQFVQFGIQTQIIGVVWIQGDHLAKIILGFSVVLLFEIDFIHSKERVGIARIRHHCRTQVREPRAFAVRQKTSLIVQKAFHRI